MCSGSEVGLYLRLIDFGYRSTLGLRAIEKKKKGSPEALGLSGRYLLDISVISPKVKE